MDAADEDSDEYEIKTVRNALGPNPECDPYPSKKYKDGRVIFLKKYADVFYKEYPELKDVPFPVLKNHHADNPIIKTVIQECTAMNKEHAEKVEEWSKKWPEYAQKVISFRKKATMQRKDRKVREKIENDPTNKRRRVQNATTATASSGFLTPEAFYAHVKFLKMCNENICQLIEGQGILLDYMFGEHADRVREIEYERQYIN
jgi:hypothetical protein